MNIMNIVRNLRSVTNPRWDGACILFRIEVAGRAISCAISRIALQELSGCRHIPSSDLLRRFAEGRDRIEEIATNIFAMRPDGVTGTLHIWADDIDDPPSAPTVAHQANAVRI
jgi:Protein of unknown function (DUF1488)